LSHAVVVAASDASAASAESEDASADVASFPEQAKNVTAIEHAAESRITDIIAGASAMQAVTRARDDPRPFGDLRVMGASPR
jgi:hypothetical protein